MKEEKQKNPTGSDLIRAYLLGHRGQQVTYEELSVHTGMKLASVRSFCQQFNTALVPNENKTGVRVGTRIGLKDLVRGGIRGKIMIPAFRYKSKKGSR